MNRAGIFRSAGKYVAIVALATAVGAGMAHYQTAPWRYFTAKAGKYVFTLKTSINGGTYAVETILLSLEARRLSVPSEGEGGGGGLAAFGDGVLLMTRLGRLFYSDGPDHLQALDIDLPDNGLEAYRAASASLPGFQHDFKRFRFNDIIAFDRKNSTRIWVTSTIFDPDALCIRSAVFGIALPVITREPDVITGDASDWELVFQTRPCLPLKKTGRAIEGHMAGGRMSIGGDGLIYLSSGSYKWSDKGPDAGLAQKPDNDYGKIIAIDPDSLESRHVSVGHRNAQGIAFDSAGRLLVTEHGMRGGDELNIINKGADYGFPSVTLGSTYEGAPVSNVAPFGRHDNYQRPVFAWLPSIAPSNLKLISGFDATWDGDMIMGTLKDKSLYRLRLHEDRLLFAERIPLGERIRYVEVVNGRLAVWMANSSLVWIKPSGVDRYKQYLANYLEEAELPDERRDRLESVISGCRECHSLGVGSVEDLPGLAGLAGSGIGSAAASSEALKNRVGKWSAANLSDYIASPQNFAPGTFMPDPGIPDRESIDDLIRFLEALKTLKPLH